MQSCQFKPQINVTGATCIPRSYHNKRLLSSTAHATRRRPAGHLRSTPPAAAPVNVRMSPIATETVYVTRVVDGNECESRMMGTMPW